MKHVARAAVLRTAVAGMTAAALAGAAPLTTAPASAATGPLLKACYNLRALTDNDHLVNGAYRLTVSSETAELRQAVTMNGSTGPDTYEALTWSRTNPAPPPTSADRTVLALHCSGDLALRRSNGTLLWHSNTAGKGVVRLALTSGGNLVLQDAAGRTVWQSRTGRAAIAANSILASNSKLDSDGYYPGGQHLSLSMQTDGNLVFRQNSTVTWQSNTHVKGSYARLTTRAQLQVVTPSGSVLWSSRPTATSYSVLDVGDARIWQYAPSSRFVWGFTS